MPKKTEAQYITFFREDKRIVNVLLKSFPLTKRASKKKIDSLKLMLKEEICYYLNYLSSNGRRYPNVPDDYIKIIIRTNMIGYDICVDLYDSNMKQHNQFIFKQVIL